MIEMRFIVHVLMLFILIGFLVKPVVLPNKQTKAMVSSASNGKILQDLYAAAQRDLCGQISFYSSNKDFWKRANRNCEQIMYKYKALPVELQYYCQKPSLPARCQKRDGMFSSYECTFEAEFVMNPDPRDPVAVRFQAKMITCVNSIKHVRPAAIPVAHPPSYWNPAQPPHNWNTGPHPHGSFAVPYSSSAYFFPEVNQPFIPISGPHHPPGYIPASNYPTSSISVSSGALLPSWTPSWLTCWLRSKKTPKS